MMDEFNYAEEKEKYRYFALIVTDDELGGIQRILKDDEKALEIWTLGPRVVEMSEEDIGVVQPGWYLRHGKFVPAEER
jgi:hypothetical protein